MAINFGEKKGGVYGYYCLSSDVADLDARAEIDKCWSGSWAYCVDTGDKYMYDADGKRWFLQGQKSGGDVMSIDDTIPCFVSGDDYISGYCLLAIRQDRSIIRELSELSQASMILNVSSGAGIARACYRSDDSSHWYAPDSEYSLGYRDNCTFNISGTVLTIQSDYTETIENLSLMQVPLAYISVGKVGS